MEGTSTHFRARTQKQLFPIFKKLQAKHPTAEMKWFEYGKLWRSPSEVGSKPDGINNDKDINKRSPDWRPGGNHSDPRARFKKKRKRLLTRTAKR